MDRRICGFEICDLKISDASFCQQVASHENIQLQS